MTGNWNDKEDTSDDERTESRTDRGQDQLTVEESLQEGSWDRKREPEEGDQRISGIVLNYDKINERMRDGRVVTSHS